MDTKKYFPKYWYIDLKDFLKMDSGYFLVAFLNEVDFSTAQKILGSKVPSFGEKHWLPLTLLRINWAKQKQAFAYSYLFTYSKYFSFG